MGSERPFGLLASLESLSIISFGGLCKAGEKKKLSFSFEVETTRRKLPKNYVDDK